MFPLLYLGVRLLFYGLVMETMNFLTKPNTSQCNFPNVWQVIWLLTKYKPIILSICGYNPNKPHMPNTPIPHKKNWQSYLELRVYLDCNAGSPDQFFGRASVWIRARICNHANYLVTAFCFCTRVLAKWWRQISPPNRWRAKFWQGSLRRNPNSPLIQTDT